MVLSKITKGFIPKLIQEIDREAERWEKGAQTIGGGCSGRGGALVRHCSNGGEEVGVGEVQIRRRRWTATWWRFPSAWC